MELELSRPEINPIVTTGIEGLELIIARYAGLEPLNYDVYHGHVNHRRVIQPNGILFCISKKREDLVTVVHKCRTMNAATKCFDEHVFNLKKGNFKIVYKTQMTYEI